ncbi:hypothetical protein HOY82DRAFT_609977 [Tuber indicum]|nr:hypothetical protein HOY82DRAFT_609977 [Tuber indicum]
MVGKYALRWMGAPVYTGYTIDILVRTTQLVSIHQEFIQTAEWLEVDESVKDELVWEFHAVLLESEFHPYSSDRSVRPYLIMDGNIKFAGDQPITFPIFIPTIPQFLDSFLDCIGDGRSSDNGSCALPQIDIYNLARYLVLDSPSQQARLLAKVTNSEGLTQYFEKQRPNQERGMKRVMERQMKHRVDTRPGPGVPSVEVPLRDLGRERRASGGKAGDVGDGGTTCKGGDPKGHFVFKGGCSMTKDEERQAAEDEENEVQNLYIGKTL